MTRAYYATDTDGTNPVEGVSLYVTITTANGNQLGAGSITDADGAARFTYMENSTRDGVGTYTVSAEASMAGDESGTDSTTFEIPR